MQPRQMVRPRIKEISGVDHPAHLTEGWLLMKDASPETAAILAEAEAIAKGITPPSPSKENNMGLSTEVRAALPDDVAEYVKSLEEKVAETKSVRKSAKDEAKEFEKSLEGMAPSVRETFRKQQQSLAEAEAMAKSLYDERETARFEEMAKSLVHLPGTTAEFGEVLRKAADSTDESTFDGIFSVLKAADAAIKESGLFKEIGTGQVGTSDAQSSIEAFAKELQAKDSDLTYAEAVAKAAEQHPDLYATHRQEA